MAQIVITLRVRRHTHTVHALIAENCQEHAHAWVCSALTDRVLQCPSVMAGLIGDGVVGPLSGCVFRDETSSDHTMQHGTS